MKRLLKIVLLPIVLLTMISLTPSAWAEPENNPPKCPPHSYGGTQNECSVGYGTSSVPQQKCNTTPSAAVSLAKGAVNISGECKQYQTCVDCGERYDLPNHSISPKSGSIIGDYETENSFLKPGSYAVGVSFSCHRDFSVNIGIGIKNHEFILNTGSMHRTDCHMIGKPAYSNNMSYVQYQSIKVPVGSAYRFGMNWNPDEGNRAGKDVFYSKECKVCNGTWAFPENQRPTAWHHEELPNPTSTGVIHATSYPHVVSFPNTTGYSVNFTKLCEQYLHTFYGWEPVDISIGGCSPGSYTYNIEAIGVNSLVSYSKFYDAGDNKWYLLRHIDADPANNILERSSILNLQAYSSSGSWPTINPYYNNEHHYDPLDPDKDKVYYPQWSCSTPYYYTQPNNYDFYTGSGTSTSTNVNGHSSVSFKGKSCGDYAIAAICGTDQSEDADPYNNIARKTKWVYVIDPDVKVNVNLPEPTVSSGMADPDKKAKKVVNLECGSYRVVKVDLSYIANNADIGNLAIKIIPERFADYKDLPEYEVYTSSDCKTALSQYSVEVEEEDEEHQLYSLAHFGGKAVYVLIKTPGYITTQLTYTLGDYITKTDQDIFLAFMPGCSSETCSTQNTNINTDSVHMQFDFGNSNFSTAGGFFKLEAETLDINLFSLSNIDIIQGTNTSIAYDPNHPGYPILVETGRFKTEFSYQLDSIGDSQFVKSMTATFYESNSTSPLSTTTALITYDANGVVSSFDATYTKHTDSGNVTRTWSVNQLDVFCPEADKILTFWKMDDGQANSYLAYDQEEGSNIRTKYRYFGNVSAPVAKVITVEQKFSWGYETVSETERGQTTTYEYYPNAIGAKNGLIKKITYPRGNTVEYSYDASGRVSAETITEGGAIKLIQTSYNENTTTVITRYNDEIISKTQSTEYYDGSSLPDSYTRFDEEDQPHTTYTYKIYDPNGAFHLKPRLVVNPDGTVTVYEYSRSASQETTTKYTGVPDSPSSTSPTVIDGSKTVYTTNSSGQMIYSASWDIASNVKLSETTAVTTDDLGRVTKYQYLNGTTSETSFGCCGAEWTKDQTGVETTYAYDEFQRLSHTTSDGITTLYTYDELGNITNTTVKGRDDTELTSSQSYSNGELATSTDPMNNVTSYSDHGDTVTYPNGTFSSTSYNQGVVSGVSGTAVHPLTYSYGPNWQKTMPADITTYTDMLGRQFKTVYADGTYSQNYYNSKGQVYKQVSPGGMINLTEYDGLGRVYRNAVDMNRNGIIDADDEITVYAYSYSTRNGKNVSVSTVSRVVGSDSKVLSVSENSVDGMDSWVTVNGLTSHTSVSYNGNGSVQTTATNPDGSSSVSTSVYGKIITVQQYNNDNTPGNLVTYTYDEFNRVASITETYGATTVNSTVYSDYNANGQPGTVTVNGRATTYVYDNMGRRTSVTSPGARTVNYGYSNTGELASVNGADTYTQAYAYDAQGRMSTLTTYKDASTPQITSWVYNNRGFMTGKNYADGNGVAYGYNADGQLTLRTWARGITTAYTYDNAGRQTGIDYSDFTPDVGYTYDWMGNPATVTDATGTHVFTYDYATAGHPGLASATVPYILNHSVAYAYDALGRRISMSLMNGLTPALNNAYTYDVQNRLASVGNGTHAAHYTRLDGSGLLSNTAVKTSGGTTLLSTNRAYDAYYRMTSIASTAGATTRSYAYTYNDKDQRTICTLADGSYWEYAYDDKGQVTGGIKYDAGGVAIPGMSFGYDYDGIGNRYWETRGSALEQLDYTSNLLNQYTVIDTPLGTTQPTYDPDGNMLTNGDWTYTWNGENRLIVAESADKRLEFAYDYMGRRVSKRVYTGSVGNWTLASESKYVYDGYYQIAEFDGSDNMLKSYLRAGGEIYAVTDANQNSTYFYMTDGNKNIMTLVDESGNVQADYIYDPFGRIIAKSGAYADANAFRFSSEFHDDETNLVYYNYRYYSPDLGRWIKRDPIEEQGGYNLYGFVRNRLELTDIQGLLPSDAINIIKEDYSVVLGKAVGFGFEAGMNIFVERGEHCCKSGKYRGKLKEVKDVQVGLFFEFMVGLKVKAKLAGQGFDVGVKGPKSHFQVANLIFNYDECDVGFKSVTQSSSIDIDLGINRVGLDIGPVGVGVNTSGSIKFVYDFIFYPKHANYNIGLFFEHDMSYQLRYLFFSAKIPWVENSKGSNEILSTTGNINY